MKTIEEIRKFYERSYFSQVHKWGYDLTQEEAIELGLLKKVEVPKEPVKPKGTRKKTNKTNKEA